MIVVGLLAIIVGMGVPSLLSAMRKEGMRKAVSDMVEACTAARASAILTSRPMDLVIRPFEKTINVLAANSPSTSEIDNGGTSTDDSPAEAVKGFSGTLPEGIHIEILGVNFQELQEAEEARVRFYPNGTSDEFTIILRSDANEYRKITLEIVTALPEVEVVR
ncbi:MAG: hypothetical protein H7X97_02105 [Opitutaceae bacterium]|nr:hypothetical protein [Verrucomicrobiales bacterium]